MRVMWDQMDEDGSGEIDLQEFVSWWVNRAHEYGLSIEKEDKPYGVPIILGDGRIALILDIAGLTALKPALPMPSEEAEQLAEITETQAVEHPANPDESLATSTEPDESTTNNREPSTPQHTWA